MKTWTDLRIVSRDPIAGFVALFSPEQPFEPRDIGNVLEIDFGTWRFRSPVYGVNHGIAYVGDHWYIPLTTDSLKGRMDEGIGYPLGVWGDETAQEE